MERIRRFAKTRAFAKLRNGKRPPMNASPPCLAKGRGRAQRSRVVAVPFKLATTRYHLLKPSRTFWNLLESRTRILARLRAPLRAGNGSNPLVPLGHSSKVDSTSKVDAPCRYPRRRSQRKIQKSSVLRRASLLYSERALENVVRL